MKKHVLVTESFLSLHTLRLVIILLAFMPNYLQGQSSGEQGLRPSISDEQTNLVPPSPNAASLGKFVDVPVSLYTGVPSISVPIYNLTVGSLQVPIGLSYHGSGLKTNEISSSVGAGWALEAGGTLSRTIRGIADNAQYGYFTDRAGEIFGLNGNPNQLNVGAVDQLIYEAENSPLDSDACAFIRDWLGGCIDTEPDMFFISAPGLSHKFMFDRERNYHLLPYDVIEMEHPFEGLSSSWNIPGGLRLSTWKVKDKNGAQYIFGGGSSEKTITQGGSLSPCMSVNDYTSWNLKKMVSANLVDTIFFEYEEEILQYFTNSFTNVTILGPQPYGQFSYLFPPTFSTQNLTVYQNRVKSITSSRGHEIVFVYDPQEREDVTGGHRLQEVIIRYQGVEKKRIRLSHDYYESFELTANSKRDRTLCLTKVEEIDLNGHALAPHMFEYKTHTDGRLALPRRHTNQQDYWGFYEKDPTLGILNKVVYPTGGEARFVFEEHDFSALENIAYEPIPNNGSYRFEDGDGDANGVQEFTFSVSNRPNGDVDTVRVNFQTETSEPNAQITGHPYFYAKLYQDLGGGQRAYVGSLIESLGFKNLTSGNYIIRMRMKSYNQGGMIDEIPEESNLEDDPPSIVIDASDFIDLDLDWIGQGNEVLSQKGAGVRIQKIIMDNQGNNSPTMVKYYGYSEESSGESSGRLKSRYGHRYENLAADYEITSSEQGIPGFFYRGYADIQVETKASPVPLGLLQGSAVGYGEVHVLYGQKTEFIPPTLGSYNPRKDYGNNGIEKHYFTNPTESRNSFNDDYPAVPEPMDDFMYGLPTKTEYYKYQGDDSNGLSMYQMVSKEEHTYTNPILKATITGIKPAWTELRKDNVTDPTSDIALCPMEPPSPASPANQLIRRVFYKSYTEQSKYIQRIKTIATQYDANGQAFVTETQYTYHPNNLLPEKVSQILEGNKKIINRTYYPEDFELLNLPTSGPYANNYVTIGDLLARHQRSTPILQTVSHVDAQGQEGIVSMQVTVFDYYPVGDGTNSAILPSRLLMNKEEAPSSPGNLQLDQLYDLTVLEERLEYLAYDNQANLLSLQKTKDIPITYVWGYHKTYPVAKIEGATRSEVDAVNLSQTILDNPASESALLSELDKLRQQLPEAFVTTYAYDPLRGIKEMVDPNGKKMSYEYDDFGRLSYIKDQDGYIVKTYEYHYASEGTE